jgi:hypothetical protein
LLANIEPDIRTKLELLEAEADEEDREAIAQVKVWEALAEQRAREQRIREEKEEAARAEDAATADQQSKSGEEQARADEEALLAESEETTDAITVHTEEVERETSGLSDEGHTDKPCALCGHKPRNSDDESDRSVC